MSRQSTQMRALSTALRTLPKTSQAALRDEAKTIVEPTVKKIASAFDADPRGRYIRPTIRVGVKGAQPVIRAGRQSGLSLKLFYGTEFGGRKRVRTYRSRRGRTVFDVTRRTTMQFPEHNGRKGRFFYPTLRGNVGAMLDKWGDAVIKALEEAS